MIISVATLFPALYDAFLATSLVRRAQDRGTVTFEVESLFAVCEPKERVDAPTYGHSAGMAIRPEVIERMVARQEERHGSAYRIFFSPRGERLTQDVVRDIVAETAKSSHIALFAARYEGIDARAEMEYAHRVISVGDFVLMGGDLPAQFFLEAYLRYLPGVVGDRESVEQDSFSGALVDCPTYTAPAVWRGRAVPEVVRSGNHAEIVRWAECEGARAAVCNHFGWVRTHPLSKRERAAVQQAIPSHYVVLMHDEINLPNGAVGTTSVTSLDIHDIARSGATYGIKGYLLVTPLVDQQAIVQTLLSFWQEGDGTGYNLHRAEALAHTRVIASLDAAVAWVAEQEGKAPLVIATSARSVDTVPCLTYVDQGKVWSQGRPVILVLGTGRGLAQQVYDRVDYLLAPLEGLPQFNHLSVRSAAAIILDRWMGLNPSTSIKKG